MGAVMEEQDISTSWWELAGQTGAIHAQNEYHRRYAASSPGSGRALTDEEDLCDDLFVPLTVYFFATVGLALIFTVYWLTTRSVNRVSLRQLLPGIRKSKQGGLEEYGSRISPSRTAGDQGMQESWQIDPRELRFGKLIGKGNVGEVYEGHYRGRKVAIKKLLGNWFNDEEMVERFRDEIYLMSTMQHPNVLVFIGAVMNPVAGNLSLVTELCNKGDVYSYLHSSQKINWSTRINLAADIARGMHYLHGRAGIIQRDLKSTNLLLDDYYTVKIADFGLSRQMRPMGQMETYCGTPATMAPEIVRQEAYDEKADVFSFAIILWEILTREDPYPDRSGLGLAYAVANEGLRPPIPAYCPLEYAQLMSRAWRHDPNNRPSFSEVVDVLQLMQQMIDNELRITRTRWSHNAAQHQQQQGMETIERLAGGKDTTIQIEPDDDVESMLEHKAAAADEKINDGVQEGVPLQGVESKKAQQPFYGASPKPSEETSTNIPAPAEESNANTAVSKEANSHDTASKECYDTTIRKSSSSRSRYPMRNQHLNPSDGNGDNIVRTTTLDRWSLHRKKNPKNRRRKLRRSVGSADEAEEEDNLDELQEAQQSVEEARNAQKANARKLQRTLLKQKETEENLQRYLHGDSMEVSPQGGVSPRMKSNAGHRKPASTSTELSTSSSTTYQDTLDLRLTAPAQEHSTSASKQSGTHRARLFADRSPPASRSLRTIYSEGEEESTPRTGTSQAFTSPSRRHDQTSVDDGRIAAPPPPSPPLRSYSGNWRDNGS
eukprot:gb/GECG01009832.1/.p1 GENE.gb/GECG01009832.1/~~gb/GECG01009832.1/.p1  ORF type:complete len:774 (+),score=94.80 gb/GECG01009832.1/:1-2322(+)